MAQAESKLSREIQQALKLKNWFCFKVHGSEYMMAGLPDIICCAEGFFFGLEVKMPGKRENISPRQDYVHQLIKGAHGQAFVVTSPEEAVSKIEKVLFGL